MKFTTPFLMGLAAAQPLVHGHHDHQKRDVVTVMVTQVVTVPYDGSSPTTSQETTTLVPSTHVGSLSSFETVFTSASAPIVPSEASEASVASVASVEPTSEAITLSPVASAVSSSTNEQTSTKSASASSYSSTSTGGVSYASGKGITYSPYTDDGSCKDSDTIASDIALLGQFELIRVYDTDCDCVSALFSSKSSNQKLFLGIYYLDKIEESVSIIQDAVNNGGSWDDVYTVSVGNELVNAGTNTPSEISAAITSARGYLTTAGYSGYVVSVDTLVAVQNNPDLCDYSDYVAVNSHPFWDGGVTADQSGEFLTTQIANIGALCGKDVLITETGWPTQGDNYGDAVPSAENQVIALESIGSAVADQVILFTTFNDLWKDAGTYGVECYWGIFD